MIGLIPALLVAAALCVAPAGPGGRVTATTPKAPRDGPETADPERCASDIELFAACVSAGLPAATAAAAVADTHGTRSPWHTVASLTALGVEPQRAWAEIRHLPGGEDLAGLVALSATSGTSLAAGCGRIAAQLRAGAGDRAKAKAERAGVLIAIPLTAFFLPAFFVLGLAPAVISLGTSLIN
ncbi:type II secretion system F family protein [Corynebacterium sp. CQ3829_602738]